MAAHSPHRRGAILIVAMIIVFALASMALVLGSYVRTEATAAANQHAAQEAAAIVLGAEQYVLSLLTERLDDLDRIDERSFAAVPVGNGYFWVLRSDFGDPLLPAYGLADESTKIHLNSAGIDLLSRLPGMTEDLAAAIVSWRSDQIDLLSTHYLALAEPYREKNSNFETVEELLLVRGMTPELLYGQDAGQFVAQRHQTHGLYEYFTVWNSQRNRTPENRRRININSNSNRQRNALRQLLHRQLDADRAEQVIAAMGNPPYEDIFDFARRAELETRELELIEDNITTTQSRRLVGRININSAPREILLCIQGLSEDDVERLLSHRPGAMAINPHSVAWVLEALEDRAIGLGDQITGRGRQFSADIVAVSGNGRAYRRVRIVVDAAPSPPRIVYRRDMTDLGWPLDPAIRDQLRTGGALTR